jgi:hypothetical protein
MSAAGPDTTATPPSASSAAGRNAASSPAGLNPHSSLAAGHNATSSTAGRDTASYAFGVVSHSPRGHLVRLRPRPPLTSSSFVAGLVGHWPRRRFVRPQTRQPLASTPPSPQSTSPTAGLDAPTMRPLSDSPFRAEISAGTGAPPTWAMRLNMTHPAPPSSSHAIASSAVSDSCEIVLPPLSESLSQFPDDDKSSRDSDDESIGGSPFSPLSPQVDLSLSLWTVVAECEGCRGVRLLPSPVALRGCSTFVPLLMTEVIASARKERWKTKQREIRQWGSRPEIHPRRLTIHQQHHFQILCGAAEWDRAPDSPGPSHNSQRRRIDPISGTWFLPLPPEVDPLSRTVVAMVPVPPCPSRLLQLRGNRQHKERDGRRSNGKSDKGQTDERVKVKEG